MNFLAVLFLACIAIHTGFSSDPALNTSSLSGSIPTSEELETCPTNSSITVKVLCSLKGEWVTTFYARRKLRNHSRSIDFNVQKDVMECNGSKYISISGYLMDKDADNSSEVFVGEHRNFSGGEDSYSGKGSIDSQTIADISDRVKNTESKLTSIEETINKLMLMMENATRHWSIESQTIADISDRVENTESKLVSMEETMNKLMLTMESATQNSKIEEKSNYAFDAIFKGIKIELSADLRNASRLRPHEDYGRYGGVFSNNPLRDDVAFEVRIDETIDEWRNWGIAVGVIAEKDEEVKEEEYICLNVPGTHCITSWWDSVKEKSHIYKDSKRITWNAYDLDTRDLPVGTTLGVVRRSNNALHFLLNGIDKGAAFVSIPHHVYAFVDVSRYVSKVSIIS